MRPIDHLDESAYDVEPATDKKREKHCPLGLEFLWVSLVAPLIARLAEPRPTTSDCMTARSDHSVSLM